LKFLKVFFKNLKNLGFLKPFSSREVKLTITQLSTAQLPMHMLLGAFMLQITKLDAKLDQVLQLLTTLTTSQAQPDSTSNHKEHSQ